MLKACGSRVKWTNGNNSETKTKHYMFKQGKLKILINLVL